MAGPASAPATAQAAPARRLAERVVGGPLRLHVCVLAIVLLGLLPALGPPGRFSVDEGAAIAQARLLAEGSGWTADHPFAAADPIGEAFPVEGSTRTDAGWAPLAKHPVYAFVLSLVFRLAGPQGLVVLSVVGAVAAAAFSALLARRLGPTLAVPTLWVVGAGSPLLLDGFVVIAHPIGAAFAGGATLAVVRWRERGELGDVLAAAAGLGGLVLFRSEGVLYAVALAVAAGVFGAPHGRRRWWVPVLLLTGTGAAYLLDGRLTAAVLGSGGVENFVIADPEGSGLIADRIDALVTTWLRPSYGDGLTDLLMVGAGASLVVAVGLAPKGRLRSPVTVLCAVAAGLAIARLLLVPRLLVPGLFAAFPVLLVGLAAMRRTVWRRDPTSLLGGTFVLFGAGVLATQYSAGGTWEWGGRYFAVALPAIVPVAMAGLHRRLQTIDRPVRHPVVAGLTIVSVTVSLSALLTLRSTHLTIEGALEDVERVSGATPPGDGGAPLVVSTDRGLARFSGAFGDGQRWLVVRPEALEALGDRLSRLGVRRFTLVAKDRQRELAALGSGWVATVDARPGSPVIPIERL